MGIMDFFSPSKTQTTTTNSTQTGQQSGSNQSNLWPQLSPFFSQYASTAFNPAPFNQYQTGAANNQAGVASGLNPAFNAANTAASGANYNPTSYQPWMSEYTDKVANSTLGMQGLQKQQDLQLLGGNEAVKGALGNNTGNRAAYLAGRAPADTAAINQIYQQGFNTANTNAYNAGQYQLAGAGTAGALTGAATGANQGLFGQGQTMWGNNLDYLVKGASGLSPFLTGAGNKFTGESSGTSTGTSNTRSMDSPSPFQVGLTGLSTAMEAAPFLMALSDERAKDNIKPIGKTFDGQPIYRYNYKGSPRTEIGLLAQDVEHDHPDAVGSISGLKTVNYDRATSKAADKGRFASGGPVGGGSFADKVQHAFQAMHGMHKAAAGGRIGYDLGGWVTDVAGPSGLPMASGGPESDSPYWDGIQKTAETNQLGQNIKGLGSALGKASNLGASPSGAGSRPDTTSQDALARSQSGLSQFMAQSDPRRYLQPSGYDEGGTVRPELWPGARDMAFRDYVPEGSSGLGFTGKGEMPELPSPSRLGAPEGPPPSRAMPAPATPAAPGIWDRLKAAADNSVFGGSMSPRANFSRSLMAGSGPLLLGPVAKQLDEIEHERMARQIADTHMATLTGRLPNGQETMAGRKLPAEIAHLEAQSEPALKRIKEFEHKTQKDLSALEQLRKTESDIDSAVMYGAITQPEGEARRQAARQLYLRSQSQIQDVNKPLTPQVIPPANSSGTWVPGVGFKLNPQ